MGVEIAQVVKALAHADLDDGQLKLVADGKRDAALGRSPWRRSPVSTRCLDRRCLGEHDVARFHDGDVLPVVEGHVPPDGADDLMPRQARVARDDAAYLVKALPSDAGPANQSAARNPGRMGPCRWRQLRDMQVLLHALDAVKTMPAARRLRAGTARWRADVSNAWSPPSRMRLCGSNSDRCPGVWPGVSNDLKLVAAHRHRVAAAHESRPQAPARSNKGCSTPSARPWWRRTGPRPLAIRPRERIEGTRRCA